MSEQTGSPSGGGGTPQELFTMIPVDLFRPATLRGREWIIFGRKMCR
jgi:hypothetical protein